jgi:hypothetical protein
VCCLLLLVGGYSGIALRILDAAFILLACQFTYRLARACWGEAEGRTAALLTAFFTAFYLPAAVIPFTADALPLTPHLAAVYSSTLDPLACYLSEYWLAPGRLETSRAQRR